MSRESQKVYEWGTGHVLGVRFGSTGEWLGNGRPTTLKMDFGTWFFENSMIENQAMSQVSFPVHGNCIS